jgi:hypothetical protein
MGRAEAVLEQPCRAKCGTMGLGNRGARQGGDLADQIDAKEFIEGSDPATSRLSPALRH